MIVLFPMLISKSVSPNVIPGICKTLEKFVLVYKMDDILGALSLAGATVGAAKHLTAYTGLARRSESVDILEQDDEITIRYSQADARMLAADREKLRQAVMVANSNWKNAAADAKELEKVIARKKEKDEDTTKLEKRLTAVNIEKGRTEIARSKAQATLDKAQQHMNKDRGELERTKVQLQALDALQSEFRAEIGFPKTEALNIEPTWVTMSTPSGTRIIGVKVVPFEISPRCYTSEH